MNPKIRKPLLLATCITLSSGLPACANMSESEAGATIGAGVGATAAFLRCRLLGTDAKDCINDAAAGAALGGVIGGIYGQTIEKRREAYESDADFYAGENVKLASRNDRLRKQNRDLATRITKAQQEESRLRSKLASSSEKQAEFERYVKIAEKSQKAVAKAKSDASEELKIQESLLVHAKKSGSGAPSKEVATLEREIRELKAQIDALDSTEEELAAISSTTF